MVVYTGQRILFLIFLFFFGGDLYYGFSNQWMLRSGDNLVWMFLGYNMKLLHWFQIIQSGSILDCPMILFPKVH